MPPKTPQAPTNVRVRFAPSPTGFIHIGNLRAALFNWLFARRHGGAFVLRIEDTDKERSKTEYEKGIIDALRWLGLDWEEGPDKGGPHAPYRQSERTALYEKYLTQLLQSGRAYYCYCTKDELEAQRESLESAGLAPKYTGRCRNFATAEGRRGPEGRDPEVIRFKVPEAKVKFHDEIRGQVEFDAALFGDIVIAKDVKTPLYNFAVVVDDHEMGITHVIRGEDHIANTPKQILFAQALGFPQPAYAHIPLILNPDRSKFSKRGNQASFADYQEKGYLPEAMLNFLALLGWHPKGNEELFNKDDLVREFDLKRVQKAGAIFNIEKLNWINAQYLKKLSTDELVARLMPYVEQAGLAANGRATARAADPVFVGKVAEAERDRLKSLGDFMSGARFFFMPEEYDPKLLQWKDDDAARAREVLRRIKETIAGLPNEELTGADLVTALGPLTDTYGRGSVLWPLRVAVSGRKASPDPIVIAAVLGKTETLRRIETALDALR